MASALSTASMICYILSAVFLVLSIVLFIALRIPKVFSDYTGRSAKKKIMAIREANNGETVQKKNSSNSKKLKKDNASSKTNDTKKKMNAQERIGKTSNQTVSLAETGLIDENKVESYTEETTGLLNGSDDGLNDTGVMIPIRQAEIKLTMIDSVMIIHTDEVIS